MEGYADFSAQIWLSDVLVEDAKSKEDLIDKLKEMTLEEMLQSGMVQDIQINDDIDVTITEVEQKVKVYNIDWDLSDIEDSDELEEVLKDLPETVEVEVRYNPSIQDITDSIDEELELECDYPVNRYDYEIVETR